MQEAAAQATALLNSPVFKSAHLAIRKKYFNMLMMAEVGSKDVVDAHARLRALEDLVADMSSVVTAEKMLKSR